MNFRTGQGGSWICRPAAFCDAARWAIPAFVWIAFSITAVAQIETFEVPLPPLAPAPAEEPAIGESVPKQASGNLAISFRKGGVVEFRGTLRTEEEAISLFQALRDVRPDLKVGTRNLVLDPDAKPIPALDEVRGFLHELALSAHEGFLEVGPDRFLVSALTDSVVIHAAFQARLKLVQFDHPDLEVRNLICIVPEEDLPAIPLHLPEALTSVDYFPAEEPEPIMAEVDPSLIKPLPDPRGNPFDQINLAGLGPLLMDSEAAGLLLPDRLEWLVTEVDRVAFEKLSDLYVALSPRVIESDPDSNVAPIFKKPDGLGGWFKMRAKPTTRPMVKLGQVPFPTNSFMLQVDQMNAVARFSKELKQKERKHDRIVLHGHAGGTGTDAFNEWLSHKRVGEVKRTLIGHGIDEARITIEIKAVNSETADPHRVDILVPEKIQLEEVTATIFKKKDAEPIEEDPVPGEELPKPDEEKPVMIARPIAVPVTEPVEATEPAAAEPSTVEEAPEIPAEDTTSSIFRKPESERVPVPVIPEIRSSSVNQ
ncbi:MAG: OmpA family protein [Verrucomicrobiales bacterium]|nr:OmpA family protein [Verrucomicrobiales bacterium]